jgi:hypothetical protein
MWPECRRARLAPGARFNGLGRQSPGELCRLLLDRSKNGNRDLQATVKHLTEDKLVAWGWAPGISVNDKPRRAVAVPKVEFNSIVIAWAKSGGARPE